MDGRRGEKDREHLVTVHATEQILSSLSKAVVYRERNRETVAETRVGGKKNEAVLNTEAPARLVNQATRYV